MLLLCQFLPQPLTCVHTAVSTHCQKLWVCVSTPDRSRGVFHSSLTPSLALSLLSLRPSPIPRQNLTHGSFIQPEMTWPHLALTSLSPPPLPLSFFVFVIQLHVSSFPAFRFNLLLLSCLTYFVLYSDFTSELQAATTENRNLDTIHLLFSVQKHLSWLMWIGFNIKPAIQKNHICHAKWVMLV